MPNRSGASGSLVGLAVTICLLESASAETAENEADLSEDSAVAGFAEPEMGIDERDLSTLSLEELLSVRVTLASKQAEAPIKAPSSVTVFTRDDIRRLGVLTLQQLLNFVPGYQTYSERSGCTRISARGRVDTLSESVLVLVDGQRLNDLYTGGVAFMAPRIAVENIEQVEVIRGPGSALYGANAFLGVINVKTNRDTRDVTVGAGNLNSRLLSINATTRTAGFDVAAFAKYYVDDGWLYPKAPDILGEVGHTVDPIETIDGQLNLSYRWLNLHVRHAQGNFSGFYNLGPASEFTNRTSVGQTSARLTAELPITDTVDVDAAASVARHRNQVLSAIIPAGTVLDPTSGFTLNNTLYMGRDYTTFSAGGNVDARWRAIDSDWLTGVLLVGASSEFAEMTKVATLSSHDPRTLRYQGDVREFTGSKSFNSGTNRLIGAGYLQAKLGLWSRFELTAGARYDWYDDLGGTLNPRAALVYETPIASHVKVMYGRAFRAPNFLELYDQNNPLLEGNADLEPAIVSTLEVAYVQQVADIGYVTVTGFRNDLSHDIVPITLPSGAGRYENTGEFSLYGLEVELRTRDLFGFRVMGNYTHLFINDDVPVQTPFDYGALAVGYSYKPVIATLSTLMRAGTPRPYDDYHRSLLSPYALLNGQVQYRVAGDVSLFILGENLLGAVYRTYASIAKLPAGIPHRGRTFIAGVYIDI